MISLQLIFFPLVFRFQDIIRQPPRDVRQPMIDNAFITNIFISATIIIAGTLSVFYREVSSLSEFLVL